MMDARRVSKHDAEPCDRRRWLHAAVRGTILAGLAALTAGLLGRSSLRSPGECPKAAACTGCALLDRCTLPQARKEAGHGRR